MVDVNTQFGGFLTNLGAAKNTNANALGEKWKLTHMLLGDANGTDPAPSPGQTALVNQVYRAQLNQLYPSPVDENVLIAELVLPPNVGGWWIRELALEDEDGVFSAVAKCPPSYKPLLAQGSGRNQVVRMHVITSGTANIQLKIDPSVVLATRAYCDGLIAAHSAAADPHPQYKIPVATEEDALLGEDDKKLMPALRVFQALRAAAANATELLRGVLRVGTQDEVDEGARDDVAVTPKKLRHGLSFSLGPTGYIFLPSWFVEFGIQWGRFPIPRDDNSEITLIFPTAWPSECYGMTQGVIGDMGGAFDGWCAYNITQTGFKARAISNSPSLNAFYIAIGH
ncbi:phage tail protein [Pseudomonas saudiphocaensis]|uniref:Tail fiber protein H n=1 Tax=Pseudomonas saudiphocaensis TaxID=1499686 RepID=A0A078LT99_9PSED|nr:phage tail protein [Pseudomonas saudiphocaensis]CDZ93577.1 tail fiber protein H [Pseudomonas saudiphocaensis]